MVKTLYETKNAYKTHNNIVYDITLGPIGGIGMGTFYRHFKMFNDYVQ